jgi:hypothetical protein
MILLKITKKGKVRRQLTSFAIGAADIGTRLRSNAMCAAVNFGVE